MRNHDVNPILRNVVLPFAVVAVASGVVSCGGAVEAPPAAVTSADPTPEVTAVPQPTTTKAAPTTAAAPKPLGKQREESLIVTLYGAYDNDPPGSLAIAYPKKDGYPTRRNEAGGTGTYADPLTIAVPDSKVKDLPPGTLAYLPYLKIYGEVEDSCGVSAFATDGCTAEVDVFVGRDSKDKAVMQCEEDLTIGDPEQKDSPQRVIINPSPNEKVNPEPLWSDATKECAELPR